LTIGWVIICITNTDDAHYFKNFLIKKYMNLILIFQVNFFKLILVYTVNHYHIVTRLVANREATTYVS